MTATVLTRDQILNGIVTMMESCGRCTSPDQLRHHLAGLTDEALVESYKRWAAYIQKKAEEAVASETWQAELNAKLAAEFPAPAATEKPTYGTGCGDYPYYLEERKADTAERLAKQRKVTP
jgi:hypothetical protein